MIHMPQSAVNMNTFLYDVPPSLMKTFCEIMDSGDDRLGWRELAARILPSWLEVRRTERVEARGKSPTWELMWSWSQQLTTVGHLLKVLQDMGHHRAIQLFMPDLAPQGAQQPKAPDHVSLPEPTVKDEDPHQPEEMTSSPPLSLVDNTVTYQDVIEGTRDFHEDAKIAEGLFADIYKGRRGSKAFVVKLFKQENKTSWKKQWDLFRREVEVHSLNRHQNILEIWGCFSEVDRCWFVYPYLPNGSLYDQLHKQGAECRLSWQQRLDVIKGTAKAVHHLHHAQPCSVICGNICSSNILLDESLQPKLSGFGTARLRPPSANQSSTIITTPLDTHSNLGYLPGEFHRDGKLSPRLDIYSLGMVIMETITGRKVIEEPKRILLNDMVAAEVEEEGGGVDGCLRFLDRRAGAWPHSVSLPLFRLALECTAPRPRSRPHSEAVLQALSQLLPLPSPPPSDQPHTLDAGVHAYAADHSPSIPVEDDEHHGTPESSLSSPKPEPCEYSQSEVTYMSCDSSDGNRGRLSRESGEAASGLRSGEGEEPVDLYNSWPVQCGCAAEAAGLGCEDCMANGFTPDQSHHTTPHDDISYPSHGIVENPAKERMRNKLDLYNKGLIKTEELLSMTR